ncbi:MAG: YdcF family protein [Saprospiraceae bacterium]|nr:YdcF family protein [Pyrinomonadaceae bacterium]
MGRKLRGVFCFLGLLMVWILIAPFLAGYLVVQKPLETADAIVVLSGSAAYMERTREAADIFKTGIAPKILLTNDGRQGGWNSEEQRNPYFAERAYQELIEHGVPGEAIEILWKAGEGTNDEADLIAETAAERGFKSVLLVTSAYHSRRALWTFERAMDRKHLQVNVGIRTPLNGSHGPPQFDWWLNGKGWKYLGSEYIKMAYYWICY